jgi:hypothetical protein
VPTCSCGYRRWLSGIPLTILFPETNFYLVDVIAKKIKVVQEVAAGLGLKNVRAEQKRAETINEEFDFIVSRAVTNMPDFVKWVRGKVRKTSSTPCQTAYLFCGRPYRGACRVPESYDLQPPGLFCRRIL